MYEKQTVYIVGNSKTNTENAITAQYNSFFIGFVVDVNNGTIVDVSCSATIRTTEEFVNSLFIGEKIDQNEVALVEKVKKRYHGSSQKAIIVAYKDAVKKYKEVTEGYL
jgi:hypothetical protein